MTNSYLVTGSSGYIGRHLVEALRAQEGSRVFGLSVPDDPNQLPAAENFHPLFMNMLDVESARLPDLLEEIQPDVIFHAVGVDRSAPLKEQLNVNVEGTRYLLQSVVDAKLTSRVVLLGSAAEYGPYPEAVDEAMTTRPVSEYGVAKLSQTLIAQLYARKYHLPVMTARVFNVYGSSPQGFAIASMASQVARQEEAQRSQGVNYPRLKVRSLQSFRDFIHIDDVVQALIALGERGYPGEIYNVASGQAVPVRLVMEGLMALSSLKNPEIVTQAEQEVDFSQGVIQKIIAHTGWRPSVSLQQGLVKELDYWRERTAFLARV